MTIGFFDSGIGGLTVLYEALKVLPYENYIYYADTLNVPYGTKQKNEVKKYIFDAAAFMASQGVKAMVIACNTATSVAIKDLRRKYDFPIIGMEPAVKPAVERNGNSHKRVLVLATQLTLKEEKFKNLVSKVDNEHIVDFLPFPELVEFAEKLEFHEQVVLPCLKDKLAALDMSLYGTIVLGCTHFPFFKDVFRQLFSENIEIIDGSVGTVKHLKRILEERHCSKDGNGEIVFYHSGRRVEDKECLDKYSRLLKRLNDIDESCR